MGDENNLTKAELQQKKEELEATIDSNKEILKHIELVRKYINIAIDNLRKRADFHDKSKLEEPEVEYFAKYNSKLAELTYNSDEYKKCLEELKPALECHYAKNDHHPEFYPNGINDMDMFSIIEMLCDWIASTDRQHDGNILKSISDNVKRFKLSDQLEKIIINTINRINK